MALLDYLLMPIRRIANMGAQMPPQPILDVEGNGFTLTDDPPNRRTILTLTGSGGGLAPLNVAEVQGTSTVAAVPQTTYEVTATAGTPGNVSITTDAFLAAPTGSTLEVIRCDAGGQTCTVAAPTGGTIQDPTTYAFGSTASLNTQNQSAAWYINGNVLRLY